MASRRNQFGTIRQRASGRYQALVRRGDLNVSATFERHVTATHFLRQVELWGLLTTEQMRLLRETDRRQPAWRPRRAIGALEREQILTRFRGRCMLCGDYIEERENDKTQRMTVDHIIPVSLGGSDDPCNLWPAHAACNGSRGSKPISLWLHEHNAGGRHGYRAGCCIWDAVSPSWPRSFRPPWIRWVAEMRDRAVEAAS